MRLVRSLACIAAGLGLMIVASAAWAHKPSDSYLDLDVQARDVDVRWDIALRDLDFALDLDRNGDGQLTWGEVRTREAELRAYVASRFSLARGGAACEAETPAPLAIDRHSDGAYLVLRVPYRCASGGALTVSYRLFADVDPTHRGVAKIVDATATRTAVLDPNGAATTFEVSAEGGWRTTLAGFASFVRDGIHHIATGYDHLAFLIALLLPAALVRTSAATGASAWVPVASMREAAVETLKIVTAFTVSHSITLSLAVLGIVEPSPNGIEIAIAITVVLAALNNVVPIVTRRAWMVALAFGLIHGFGLASALREAGHRGVSLATTLFGFNLGVEIGQLAVVAVALPLVFALRQRRAYTGGAMQVASLALAAFGTVWCWERATGTVILGL